MRGAKLQGKHWCVYPPLNLIGFSSRFMYMYWIISNILIQALIRTFILTENYFFPHKHLSEIAATVKKHVNCE
jgi:hypothetical protein